MALEAGRRQHRPDAEGKKVSGRALGGARWLPRGARRSPGRGASGGSDMCDMSDLSGTGAKLRPGRRKRGSQHGEKHGAQQMKGTATLAKCRACAACPTGDCRTVYSPPTAV